MSSGVAIAVILEVIRLVVNGIVLSWWCRGYMPIYWLSLGLLFEVVVGRVCTVVCKEKLLFRKTKHILELSPSAQPANMYDACLPASGYLWQLYRVSQITAFGSCRNSERCIADVVSLIHMAAKRSIVLCLAAMNMCCRCRRLQGSRGCFAANALQGSRRGAVPGKVFIPGARAY